MTNLSLLFYKTYYNKLSEANFENRDNGDRKKNNGFDDDLAIKNKALFGAKFNHAADYTASVIATHNFVMKVSYPGLLIGTGTQHGSGLADEDINVGFSFDYVTGQPYIPGSSVKGVLRSHFKYAPQAVGEILGIDETEVVAIEKEIFEGCDQFLDAVVFDGDEYGMLIGKDSITPHSGTTKNPVPITFLKILPDVRLEFRFVLKDGTITAAKKRFLFSTLLEYFGVGAKTNVGYGILYKADTTIAEKKTKSFAPVSEAKKAAGKPESVICPNCGTSNYKYYPDGNLRRKCRSCNNFLYPRN